MATDNGYYRMLPFIFAALTVVQNEAPAPRYAPADVPSNHWAYPAVDSLFKEGLLRGYPTKETTELFLTPDVQPNVEWIDGRRLDWKKQGLLVGYPEGLFKYPRDPREPYQQAVMIHATLVYGRSILTGESEGDPKTVLANLKDIVLAFSMRKKEMVDLNVDLKGTIDSLNTAARRWTSRFGG